MRYIEELVDLLSRVLWQYIDKNVTELTDDSEDDEEECFSGTREEYLQYLEKTHLTEEEVYFIETVDELDFD